MELFNGRMSTAARSWSDRADKRHRTEVDYSSELRSWVRLAISEAEEMKDSNKKDKFLSLLEDL